MIKMIYDWDWKACCQSRTIMITVIKIANDSDDRFGCYSVKIMIELIKMTSV